MIPYNKFFFTNVFFLILAILILINIVSFFYPDIKEFALLLVYIFFGLTILDFIILISHWNALKVERIVPEKISNNETTPVEIIVKSNFYIPTFIHLYEELPHQLNQRTFILFKFFKPLSKGKIKYNFTPKERGEYTFGNLNFFIKSPLYLFSRRVIIKQPQTAKVYPTYTNLHKYDLFALSTNQNLGMKKVRKLGHSLEFEQIKEYVIGDDVRTLNWKSTAKRNNLMVNQYTDEKSQQIYTAIDTGRLMKMPFEGMSLVDYAINSALVILKVALNNHDKAGMFTFNKNLQRFVVADKKSMQMQRILDNLYAIKPEFLETNFSNLYANLRFKITNRSLIFLYTNFETLDSMYRQLPYLRSINKKQLLVVVFFKNTEVEDFHKTFKPKDDFEVIQKTMLEKSIYDKRLIVKELNMHGIQTILTSPNELTVNVINKYLEIKSRGIL